MIQTTKKERNIKYKYANFHCCASESGIRCFFDHWIRDPQDGKKSGFEIRDEHSRSFFRELRNIFWGLKYLNSMMRIRDLFNPGSGMIKI
jgi:hypothetical protein